MPKARVRIPLELEISERQAEALEAARDVVQRARDAGLPDALARFAEAAGLGAPLARLARRRRR